MRRRRPISFEAVIRRQTPEEQREFEQALRMLIEELLGGGGIERSEAPTNHTDATIEPTQSAK
jgi:hypothetical protein